MPKRDMIIVSEYSSLDIRVIVRISSLLAFGLNSLAVAATGTSAECMKLTALGDILIDVLDRVRQIWKHQLSQIHAGLDT
jgi:hypothetical protein